MLHAWHITYHSTQLYAAQRRGYDLDKSQLPGTKSHLRLMKNSYDHFMIINLNPQKVNC